MTAYSLARSWWVLVLRGFSSIMFGLAAWAWPAMTMVVLMYLLAAYLLTDGILAVGAGLGRHKGSQPWWLLLIEGAVGILAGFWIFISPELSGLALLYLVAAWATVTGLVAIFAALRLRREIEHEAWLVLAGVLSVVLGMLLVIWPGATVLAMVWLIATYAVISGFLMIGFGFRLWNWQRSARLPKTVPLPLA